MAKLAKPISWQAEEYIVPGRNIWWYVGFTLISIGLCVLSVFLQWWTFLALIILSDIVILISAFRPPRTISYTLDNDGLTEGTVLHPYSNYKAFGIIKDHDHFSAILIPKKRLSLSTKVYFPEGSGEAIVDALGNRLPMEQVKPDLLDKIVNLLRI